VEDAHVQMRTRAGSAKLGRIMSIDYAPVQVWAWNR
jgi:hypothetical protein